MTVVLIINEVGLPKGSIVEMAFEECGTAGYEFERTPEEIASALRKLDALMREPPFNAFEYNFATYGSGLPEDLSGIPDDAVSAAYLALAFRIAPNMGRGLSAETKASFNRAFNYVSSKYATMPTAPIRNSTPRGSGNWASYWRSPFINGDASEVT